jgi:hypothetical protein
MVTKTAAIVRWIARFFVMMSHSVNIYFSKGFKSMFDRSSLTCAVCLVSELWKRSVTDGFWFLLSLAARAR